jgi:MFS family permease
MKANIKKRLQSNIWKFYLHEILAGMYFSVPIMVLFWQDNGLSLTEVMVLQSLFAIMAVALEIPSGYFADIYGRKKTLILAGIATLIAICVYSVGHNFYDFLIAEVFFAVGVSFTSGTASAFIYDTLQELKKEETYKKIWGNILFTGMLALAFANMLGGLIATIDLRYALYASIPFLAFIIPVTFTLQEPKRNKLIIEKGYVSELLKIIRETIFKNPKIRWIIVYSAIIGSFNSAALWLYQPYFKISGLDIAYFGFVFAGFQLVAALSSKYAHNIEEKLGQRFSLILLVILVTVSYLLMSNFVFLFSFSFCFLQQFVRGFRNTIIADYLNKLTTSNIRATVLSAESFVARLFYAAIIPIVGWIADVYTLVQALSVLAITTLVCGSIILFILHKDRVV